MCVVCGACAGTREADLEDMIQLFLCLGLSHRDMVQRLGRLLGAVLAERLACPAQSAAHEAVAARIVLVDAAHLRCFIRHHGFQAARHVVVPCFDI